MSYVRAVLELILDNSVKFLLYQYIVNKFENSCSVAEKKDDEQRAGQAAGGPRPRAREAPPGGRAVRRRNRGNRMQIRDDDSGKKNI